MIRGAKATLDPRVSDEVRATRDASKLYTEAAELPSTVPVLTDPKLYES
ncbi:hypothetical protein [Oligella ureolytica]|uniref:Uncharacterized protein n=1 Tax=Oligella ureolytica TaxID=90244 RepID=A0A7T3BTE5_9BURK|nr:hypothetical protein [Oligella ureolytica]QPT40775.1 hypothetical protein I6G29_04170 [Oligella ureolytica]